MAKQIILVTGGARSGKSLYAELRAAELGDRRLYVATAEAKDEEMAQRIAAHKKRRGNDWTTVEEPMELSAALLAQRGRTDCALVDCLTIWLSNLLLQRDAEFAGEKIERIGGDIAAPGFSRRIGDQRGRLGHRAGQCSRAAISRPRGLGQSANRRGSQTKSFLPLRESR